MGKNKTSPETIEKIVKLRLDGLPYKEISVQTGVTERTIESILLKKGIKLTKEQKALLIKKSWENDEERRAQLANSNKEMWQNPDFREQTTAKISEKTKERFQDPEELKKLSERTKKQFEVPENREKVGKSVSEWWSRPENHESMVSIFNTEESKEKRSNSAQKRWENQEELDRASREMTGRWEDPVFRIKTVASFNSPEFKQRQSAKLKEAANRPEVREKQAKARERTPKTGTIPHLKINSLLDSLGIKYVNEKAFSFWNYDIYIPSHKLLIEVQGDYYHGDSFPDHQLRDQQKAAYIHNNFQGENKIELKQIWEHECLEEQGVLNKLKYWLGITQLELKDFSFDQLAIIQPETKEADQFLYNFHYQHHGKHGQDYAAYLDGQIVAIARFSAPTRKEIATSMDYKYQEVLELTRLCIHPQYQKYNFASWFLSRAINTVKKERPDIKCLVTFADTTYNHSGTIYKATNWEFVHETEPNYWYINPLTGGVMHKKTLWNHANKMVLSELEYAEKYGYIKQWGKPKLKFKKVL